MAAPVIQPIPPVNLAPGEFFDLVVIASDPDSQSGSGDITVTDLAGTPSVANVIINVTDPLTFDPVVVLNGLPGVTATQIDVQLLQSTYRIQA